MQQKVGAMAKVGGVGAESDLRSCSAYDAGPSGLGEWSKTVVIDSKIVEKNNVDILFGSNTIF